MWLILSFTSASLCQPNTRPSEIKTGLYSINLRHEKIQSLKNLFAKTNGRVGHRLHYRIACVRL